MLGCQWWRVLSGVSYDFLGFSHWANKTLSPKKYAFQYFVSEGSEDVADVLLEDL